MGLIHRCSVVTICKILTLDWSWKLPLWLSYTISKIYINHCLFSLSVTRATTLGYVCVKKNRTVIISQPKCRCSVDRQSQKCFNKTKKEVQLGQCRKLQLCINQCLQNGACKLVSRCNKHILKSLHRYYNG